MSDSIHSIPLGILHMSTQMQKDLGVYATPFGEPSPMPFGTPQGLVYGKRAAELTPNLNQRQAERQASKDTVGEMLEEDEARALYQDLDAPEPESPQKTRCMRSGSRPIDWDGPAFQ